MHVVYGFSIRLSMLLALTSLIMGLAGAAHALPGVKAHGLLETAEVLVSWTERIPDAPGDVIHGYRLVPYDGRVPFDVYFDGAGELLQSDALAVLGIVEKKWDYADLDIPGLWMSDRPVQDKTHRPREGGLRAETPRYTLGPVDHAALLEEDAYYQRTTGETLIRYGINRPLDAPVRFSGGQYSMGRLYAQPDGSWEWQLVIEASRAFGLRVGFERLSVPAEVVVSVYAPDSPEDYFGPFGDGPEQWSPTVSGSVAVISCRSTSRAALEALELVVSEIVHVYRSPLSETKQPYDCYVHIACRPEWVAAGAAVGRLGFIERGVAYVCTGTLLVATGYKDNPPFMLTANHCIANQAQADTLEVWWRYERDNCDDAAPPPLEEAPRSTGGARFLVGATGEPGTDFSLLLLSQPPATGSYLGYATRPVDPDEAVVCMHHPGGSEKRISLGLTSKEGSATVDGQPLAAYTHYHEVLWHEGSTEGGSSGSPLLLEETGQIIGQLYGGYASCTAMHEPDYFGRLDVSYPLMAPWLSGAISIIEGESLRVEGESETAESEPVDGLVLSEGEPGAAAEGEGEPSGASCGADGDSRASVSSIWAVFLSVLGALLALYLFEAVQHIRGSLS